MQKLINILEVLIITFFVIHIIIAIFWNKHNKRYYHYIDTEGQVFNAETKPFGNNEILQVDVNGERHVIKFYELREGK